jgi:hypothetical protein
LFSAPVKLALSAPVKLALSASASKALSTPAKKGAFPGHRYIKRIHENL